MARHYICDVPSCGNSRRRFHRLCDRCFAALPGDIRTGINETHKSDRRAWRAWIGKAAIHLAGLLGARGAGEALQYGLGHRVTPQRAFELQARMLGERSDI